MGNTLAKRSTSRTSQTAVQWDEANVLRLITENKLAPKYSDIKADANKETCECPICFLDFTILNTVNCCKQSICTDCVLQLKTAEAKCACPFCGTADLTVSLIPIDKTRRGSTGSTGVTKDRSSSVSESDRSSGSSQVNLSYTTPEQEKKLRSLSVDNTVNMSSRTDREALERQIREQRLQFDERDLAEAQRSGGRGRGSYYHGSGASATAAGSPFQRYGRIGRYGMGEPSSPGMMGVGLRSPGANRSTPLRGAGDDTADSASAATTNSNNSFVSSIENLLQSRGTTRITSIQQLEDIMLMEAIRLSMQDAEAAAEAETEGTTGAGNSPAGSSSSSRHSAPVSPARAAPSAGIAGFAGVFGAYGGSGAGSGANSGSNSPLRSATHSATHSPPRSPGRSHVGRVSPYTSMSMGLSAASMAMPARAAGSPSATTNTSSGTTQSSADMSSLSASAAHSVVAQPRINTHDTNWRDGDMNTHGEDDDYSGTGSGTESDADEEERAQIRLAMELSLAYANIAADAANTASTANSTNSGSGSGGSDSIAPVAGEKQDSQQRPQPEQCSDHGTCAADSHNAKLHSDSALAGPSSVPTASASASTSSSSSLGLEDVLSSFTRALCGATTAALDDNTNDTNDTSNNTVDEQEEGEVARKLSAEGI